MSEPVKRDPINPTDDDARELARKLVGDAKYGALAVNEPGEEGIPLVSRVAAAWSKQTGLFFCGSDLSAHSQSLSKDPRCSLLLGEPGKGDGLAYPRITVVAHTARMGNEHGDRAMFREVFLERHPKAALYVDFLDFGFWPLDVSRALLNGGFGKAYRLNQDDMSFARLG